LSPALLASSWITGRAVVDRQPVHVHDLALAEDEFPEGYALHLRQGHRTGLAVPLLRDGNAIGAFMIRRMDVCPFSDKQASLLETFADQGVIAIENARLFEEVQARTRELAKTVEDLEIASQQKNQFVANMSHELRTPLAAILGYAELIQEGFYGALPEKSLDALARILSNGKHLLGLINTVLDIAKIESGQFTLNLTEYAIESVVETVRAATESLAQNKKLTLTTSVVNSTRWTALLPKPRAARGSGSPSPSRSWRCTAAAFGWSRRRARIDISDGAPHARRIPKAQPGRHGLNCTARVGGALSVRYP
jgi:signal transduction histidine kinase